MAPFRHGAEAHGSKRNRDDVSTVPYIRWFSMVTGGVAEQYLDDVSLPNEPLVSFYRHIIIVFQYCDR